MNISATYKRIIVSIDRQYKNSVQFSDGNKIRLQRDIDNFNRRYTQPVNGIVIDSEYIPKGAEVLLNHNAAHDTYRLFDTEQINGEEISNETKIYSIPETECYAYRIDNGDWQPTNGYEFGLRVFKPYTGFLTGILPSKINQKLFITTGEYKDKCVVTIRASDYQIIYQDSNGKENYLIRCRHSKEREEIIAIDNYTTKMIFENKYLIGITEQDCQPLNSILCPTIQ